MRYVKAFDLWDRSVNDLMYQGALKVQSGQIAYCGDKGSPCVIDEIKKGYVRAFHAPTVAGARKKYFDYKRHIKIGNLRRSIRGKIKTLIADSKQYQTI